MRTRVMVFGITDPEDAVGAANEGADFLGIGMTEGPRHVSRERAREIACAIAGEAMLVAIFAEESVDAVARAIDGLRVHAVQVAGFGDPGKALPCDVWHVLRGETLPDPATLPLSPLRTYVLDLQDDRRTDGPSARADWEWARRAVNGGVRLIVTGGLGPDNVQALVQEVRPFGVGTSSGLERESGRLDSSKVRSFVERIRETDRGRPRLS